MKASLPVVYGLLFLQAIHSCFGQVFNITATKGNGSYPSFGGLYGPNTATRWYIAVPDKNKFMKLEFPHISVEGYPNVPCDYDWIQVVDGNFDNSLGDICSPRNRMVPNIGIYCNNHVPIEHQIFLNTTRIIIEFCTDSFVQLNGFSFSWFATDIPSTATPLPSATPSTSPVTPSPIPFGVPYKLSSPGYPPGPYPNNIHCIWNVISPTNGISINTTFFDLEGYSEECDFDKLLIQNSVKPNNRFCRNLGPSYTNVGHNLTIQFISDMQVQRLGFELNLLPSSIPTPPEPVNPHCGHTYNLAFPTDEIILYSPGWPGNYPNNAYCNWTINNALFHNMKMELQFKFLRFNVEEYNDKLTVTPNNSPPIGFSGTIPANTLRVFNSSSVSIVFASGETVRDAGFHIVVSLAPSHFTCPMGQFKCATGNQCIPGSKRCDNKQDCADNSDENSTWCQMPSLCGKMVIQPNIHVPGEVLVVGGTEAKPGSWPWTVSLHHKSTGNQFSDAILISPHWIISAAHVFSGESGNPYQFIVKIGSYHDYQNDAPFEIDVGIEHIWVHPEFDPTTYAYSHDISVARLAQDVPFNGTFNNHTGVICLPQPGYMVSPGTNCVATGWGVTEGTGSDKVLRQVVVPIMSSEICNSTQYYDGKVTDTNICAGYPQGGKDTCDGDSGGPLVCKDPRYNNWVLQGITSWGIGCAQPNHPGVYSRVSKLIQFALDIINAND